MSGSSARCSAKKTRLLRQRDLDTAEPPQLQAERRAARELEKALAAHAYQKAKKEEKPFDPEANGFVFSTREIESYLARREAKKAIAQETGSFLRRRKS